MRRRIPLLTVLMIGLLSLSSVAQAGALQDDAPRYTMTDLGAIENYPATLGLAINARGAVVGQTYDPPTLRSRAFISRNGKMRALIKGEQGVSVAQDINAEGQIVGYTAPDPFSAPQAMLWDGDNATDLGDLGGGLSAALAINDDGVVVGVATSASSAFSVPFVWADGEMTALPLLPDDEQGYATNINADGLVVGYSAGPLGESGASSVHAVLWEDGEAVDLGTIGGDYSDATGINAAGQIVGRSTTAADQFPSNPGSHAALWDGDEITDLGTLAEGEISAASAINAGGEIVGSSTVVPGTNSSDTHAALWRDGEVYDLNDLLDEEADVVLFNARDINDDGLIVATGKVDDVEHAFLLTPVDD